MAGPYYVDSNAVGAGTGADWANAFTTLTLAIAGKAAGDVFYVAHNYAGVAAGALTLTFPGTVVSPNLVYCVNSAGSVPPVSADLRTTATEYSAVASATTIVGSAYFYGIDFASRNAGASTFTFANTSVSTWQRYEACKITCGHTGVGAIQFGGFNVQVAYNVDLINTPIVFSSTGASINFLAVRFRWMNTASALPGFAVPTSLFGNNLTVASSILIDGVDLSAAGAGKTLVASVTASSSYLFNNCKLGASVTTAATPATAGAIIDMVRGDSGATSYRTERYTYRGTQTTDTTIVRTGGATDGTTTIAWKIVSTANVSWTRPFEVMPFTFWNDSTSAITTLTIYGTTTGGGVPNNDDIWVEVEYLGSASTPQASFIVTTKADNLAASAATNNSSDSSTWGGGGAGNGFKIVVPSFTPGMAGPINITVKVAKTSATYYIDPKPEIAGVSVSKSVILAPGTYANELFAGMPRSRLQLGH